MQVDRSRDDVYRSKTILCRRSVEYANGNKEWYWHGQLHRRNDLPAVEYATGDKCWYLDGKLHRENDKPAVEIVDGSKCWYLYGKFIKKINSI
jgi:hypothetical protein